MPKRMYVRKCFPTPSSRNVSYSSFLSFQGDESRKIKTCCFNFLQSMFTFFAPWIMPCVHRVLCKVSQFSLSHDNNGYCEMSYLMVLLCWRCITIANGLILLVRSYQQPGQSRRMYVRNTNSEASHPDRLAKQ